MAPRQIAESLPKLDKGKTSSPELSVNYIEESSNIADSAQGASSFILSSGEVRLPFITSASQK